MADEFAIKVERVSKSFKLPHEKQNSIKGALINFHKRGYEKQSVLTDVDFEVKKGEFFGIVGRNGSGKSTLLKLMAGIYTPDSGQVHVRGKLTPFIELGVGFNPELTGRENVFLNGALLGFNRREMEAMYDEIVSFAELEKFMDQKLKNYSSGMQVRLAFSIAIRADSDILILDEVLAVGDEAFQQKCIDVFEEYKAKKRTVILVTHSMESVTRFCSRAMLIDGGKIQDIGQASTIASEYSKLNSTSVETDIISNNMNVKSNITIKMTNNNKETVAYKTGETMNVQLSWPKSLAGVKNVGVAIIKNSGEYIFGTNTFKNKQPNLQSGITYSVKLALGPGKYHLMTGLFGDSQDDVIEFLEFGPEFMVEPFVPELEHGLVRLESSWRQ